MPPPICAAAETESKTRTGNSHFIRSPGRRVRGRQRCGRRGLHDHHACQHRKQIAPSHVPCHGTKGSRRRYHKPRPRDGAGQRCETAGTTRPRNVRKGSKAEVALSVLHVRSSPMSRPLHAQLAGRESAKSRSRSNNASWVQRRAESAKHPHCRPRSQPVRGSRFSERKALLQRAWLTDPRSSWKARLLQPPTQLSPLFEIAIALFEHDPGCGEVRVSGHRFLYELASFVRPLERHERSRSIKS